MPLYDDEIQTQQEGFVELLSHSQCTPEITFDRVPARAAAALPLLARCWARAAGPRRPAARARRQAALNRSVRRRRPGPARPCRAARRGAARARTDMRAAQSVAVARLTLSEPMPRPWAPAALPFIGRGVRPWTQLTGTRNRLRPSRCFPAGAQFTKLHAPPRCLCGMPACAWAPPRSGCPLIVRLVPCSPLLQPGNARLPLHKPVPAQQGHVFHSAHAPM
jgi:hypothetical protein